MSDLQIIILTLVWTLSSIGSVAIIRHSFGYVTLGMLLVNLIIGPIGLIIVFLSAFWDIKLFEKRRQ